MAGQLADYEITGTILDDATVSCLSGRRPARLGDGGAPVTIWVLGPLARSSWAAARARIEPAASVRGDGIADWLEAGVADWAQRPVIWVSTATQVTATLGAPPPGMDVPSRLRAVAQAARGAHALHEQGVLHGAICPQAVAIHGESQAPGVSAVLAPPALADGQRLAVQIGYPPLAYVDPQLLRGEGGRWSDIWALGATLHQVVTGRPPYPGLDEQPVVQAVSQLLANPSVALAGVPEPVSDLLASCLSIDPAGRPSTASEVARRIDEVVAKWPS